MIRALFMASVLYSVILLYLSFNHLEVCGAIMLKLVPSYVFGISVCMIFWPLGLCLPGLGGYVVCLYHPRSLRNAIWNHCVTC